MATAGGRWNNSWDHLPGWVFMCPEGWLLLQECLLTCMRSASRADVTMEFSQLVGQKVPLSLPVSAAGICAGGTL